MTTKLFRRQPRKRGPQSPRGDILLESPPDMPDPQPKSIAQVLMILPMMAGAVAMMLMYAGRGVGGGGSVNPLMYVIGGMMGISMMSMMIMNISGARGNKKAELNIERRNYMRYLAQVRRKVRRGAEKQWRAQRWRHPDAHALWSLVGSRRMWERRPSDDDYLDLRIGIGQQRLVMRINPPDTKPVEDLEPMSAMALRRFVKAHSNVPDIPRPLNLMSASRITLRGDRPDVLGTMRAMLGQLLVLHSPDDVLVAVVASPERQEEWHWLKWAPHVQHPSENDGAGPLRMFYDTVPKLERSLREELNGRGNFQQGKADEDQKHIVVLIDDGNEEGAAVLAGDGAAGVTVIDFSGYMPRKPSPLHKLLDLSEDTIREEQRGRVRNLGTPDRISLGQAEGIARQLAPWRLTLGKQSGDEAGTEEGPGGVSASLNQTIDITELLGIPDMAQFDPTVHWKEKSMKEFLKVPIGPGADGGVVDVDFKEAAQGGMGPHGLLVGATGSGKSEVLRTFVAALAATHSSEELNFILVDFKGGATFAALDDMPHVSAIITNLADEIALVDRMQDALVGELVRRQELLRSAGNFTNRTEYEKARLGGAALDPMPALMIICDEFSEMLVAKPEFIDLFLQVGRIGRSIGVYQLLASQRLEEGKLRGLDTYLSYRVGLRTFSAQESRTVLGVPDAYELPQAPGHGYLQVGTEGLVRFRAAYAGGEYEPRKDVAVSRAQRVAAVQNKVQRFISGYVEPPREPEPEEEPQPDPAESAADLPPVIEGIEEGQEITQMDVLVDRMKGHGRPAHKVWLPPLEDPPTLDQLVPRMEVTADRGLCAPGWHLNGKLTAILGEEDRPFEQKRVPMSIDLAGAGGNMAIAGGTQSGKSTVLRTLIGSLALTHTPREAQFFCLDFGGGTLRGINDLPHVAGVYGRRDVEGVRRTIQEVMTILDEREAFFTAQGLDSMGTYRKMKAEGKFAEDPWGDVFLVIDNWLTLRDDFEKFVDDIMAIGNRGLSFGVHVIVTCSRWGDIRLNMRDMFGTKLELKLSDHQESEIDRKHAQNVPKGRPGRGLSLQKLHFMSGVPRVDGIRDGDDLQPGVADFVKRVQEAWQGQPCPKVRLLPRELHLRDYWEIVDRNMPGIPIGINEAGLKQVNLDFNETPHLMVFGDSECGKTNLLRLICKSITEKYKVGEAKIVMADYRRGMLGEFSEDFLLDYSMAARQFDNACKQMRGPLEKRLPGDDVTPEQLRARSWWTGPELFIVVDDYELVATPRGNPMQGLAEFIPQARDIGLHIIVARRCSGVSRASMDPIIGAMKQIESPGLLMSGRKEEGPVFGQLRPSPQPPGRGTLVRRQDGENLMQTALMPPHQ
ncbi:type VII secretion protein EccCa [Natronoglycomyces albus]|uniref:Type VII secretion protein EccCa n=1 Tax=Natronoglycomyces albus TaxID=2811108 RepID=A0A895XR63_9ACTN|nr:type VII secretion protein EccCa [Natronoglycomyces albus]QSB06013.1 type VII secretion protein EccCa [Natronoglycomyces albus]